MIKRCFIMVFKTRILFDIYKNKDDEIEQCNVYKFDIGFPTEKIYELQKITKKHVDIITKSILYILCNHYICDYKILCYNIVECDETDMTKIPRYLILDYSYCELILHNNFINIYGNRYDHKFYEFRNNKSTDIQLFTYNPDNDVDDVDINEYKKNRVMCVKMHYIGNIQTDVSTLVYTMMNFYIVPLYVHKINIFENIDENIDIKYDVRNYTENTKYIDLISDVYFSRRHKMKKEYKDLVVQFMQHNKPYDYASFILSERKTYITRYVNSIKYIFKENIENYITLCEIVNNIIEENTSDSKNNDIEHMILINIDKKLYDIL